MAGADSGTGAAAVKPVRFGVGLVVLTVVGAIGFWAGRVALEPPTDPLDVDVEPTSYVVDVGSVGRSLTFTAVAEWELVPVGENGAGGVVTSVDVIVGDSVDAGDVIYTVGLRPVVAGRGPVPMFRSLGLRSEGADVAQLQQLLTDVGAYSGPIDGDFGESTRIAVRAWQDSLGLERTGTVLAGDVVFVSELPVRVAPAEELRVGARLSGGEPVMRIVPPHPVFRIPLAVEQAALVPLSAEVFITYTEGVWRARIERAVEQIESGQLDLFLSGADGGSVCGEMCGDWVQLTDRSDFRAEIVVIPETTGPLVPVGAISVGPGNQAFVTLADGSEVEVRVIESANGVAVVDGIDLGTEILLRAVSQ